MYSLRFALTLQNGNAMYNYRETRKTIHNIANPYIHATMNDSRLYLPAEWEEQSGVQLTWPHAETDWAPYLSEITNTFIELASAITLYEPLLIVAQDTEYVKHLLTEQLSSKQMQRIGFAQAHTNDTWARDHGAITLVSDNELVLLDFRFNGWGEKFAWLHDNAITSHLYSKGILKGNYESHDDFVLEGGSIESDGRGTIFTTSQCLMAQHRNQPLTQREIERELCQRLHAKRIVWLNHGNLIGDDTDGHIDTTVRTAPGDTLLYNKCTDESDEQYQDFCNLERELQSLRTADNRPYRLVALPMPQEIRFDNERLPATYANFLIINGAIIYPTYNQPDNDKAAAEALQQTFPGRNIIGIDSSIIIRQHGSIHCLTMQFPKGALNISTTIETK